MQIIGYAILFSIIAPGVAFLLSGTIVIIKRKRVIGTLMIIIGCLILLGLLSEIISINLGWF